MWKNGKFDAAEFHSIESEWAYFLQFQYIYIMTNGNSTK